MKNKVLIISGATATGKTDLALKIAKNHQAQIINFDSLLFYNELNIGTAKPTEEELTEVKHHLVNCRSIKNPMNAAEYSKLAIDKIHELHSNNIIPILVGGSGFYLQAVLNGMYESKTSPVEITEKSDQLYDQQGIDPFLKILKDHDPISFERYHENDHYRIRRAVEHFWTTKNPFSAAREQMQDKLEMAPSKDWDVLHIYLNIPKETHWEIIQNRTDRMLSNGLIAEVQAILDQGYDPDLKPLGSIGYKETIGWIKNTYKDTEEYKERIFIATRRLAKSQRTWFNKVENKVTMNPLQDLEQIQKLVREFLTIDKI